MPPTPLEQVSNDLIRLDRRVPLHVAEHRRREWRALHRKCIARALHDGLAHDVVLGRCDRTAFLEKTEGEFGSPRGGDDVADWRAHETRAAGQSRQEHPLLPHLERNLGACSSVEERTFH